MSLSAELKHVQTIWNAMKPKSPIYNIFLGDARLVSARKGSILAHVPVAAVHLNSKGTLHGAVSSCLVDWAGGMAIASTGSDRTGVSTDMHTTFVSAAREGDVLEVEAKVSRMGSTLAYTTVEIRRQSDAAVVATGSHTKYVKI